MRMTIISCVVCSITIGSPFSALAQGPAAEAKQDVSERTRNQNWEGTLDVGVAKLRLRFDISRSLESVFTGKLISLDQGSAEVPLTKMTVDSGIVTMVFKSISSEFVGKLNEDVDECVGTWTQFGRAYDLILRRIPDSALNHIQSWTGKLVAGERTFDFQLRIQKDEQSNQHAFLDSFSERTLDLRTEFVSGDDGFEFDIDSIKAHFEGKYNEDKTEISGQWEQAGIQLPLSFKKIDLKDTRWSMPKPERPQHPKPPYPYQEQQVTFRNETDNVTLAGTLTIPAGDGPFPAAILITGSGPQDRDETLFDHKPFLVIADHLSRLGIAVLRYDERGVGESTGSFAGATTNDFARDTESGIDFLKQQAAIDTSRIGLIGHSEGGVVGPMVAARRDDVAFVVMLAGTGISGGQISLTQSRAMGEKVGLPADYLDTQEQLLTALIDETRKTKGPLSRQQIDEVANKIADESNEKKEQVGSIKSHLQTFADPWLANFIISDPAQTCRKSSVLSWR